MTDDRFILNENAGEDVIHRLAGLTESCNTDAIEGRSKVDAKTAASLIARGQARACAHCGPLSGLPPVPDSTVIP